MPMEDADPYPGPYPCHVPDGTNSGRPEMQLRL
jgi:hypothetical protein